MRRRDPENRVLKVTLLLTSTLIVMVTGVIAPALPRMEDSFAHVTNVALWVRLVLTIPCLFIAVIAPIAGYVIDRIGRKSVLVISTVLFGVSGVAGYLASTLPLLLLTRASLGIAVGGLMTSVTTLIADYYTGVAREHFMALQAAVMGFAAMAALVLGGVLADIGWRVPFLTYALAILVLPLIVLALYEPLIGERCVQRPPPVADAGQCAAESICAAQSRKQTRVSSPSIPLRFILFVYSMMMGIQITMYLIPVLLPFYLEGNMGMNTSGSGLVLSVTSISYALVALQYGRVAAQLDHFWVLVVGFALIGAGYLLMWLAGGSAILVLGLVLAGAGQGLLIPNLTVWLAGRTPASLRGRVLGGLTTALFLGVFFSPIVGQPVSAAIGFRGVCVTVVALILVTELFLWMVRGRLRHLTESTPLDAEIPHPNRAAPHREAQLCRSGASLTPGEEVGSSSTERPSLGSWARGIPAPP